MILVGCATLGLAPFTPEPHIVGKIQWILGGAVGMKPIDWFDSLLHGLPWILLLLWIFDYVKRKYFVAPKQ
jgi:hypothetical protein